MLYWALVFLIVALGAAALLEPGWSPSWNTRPCRGLSEKRIGPRRNYAFSTAQYGGRDDAYCR